MHYLNPNTTKIKIDHLQKIQEATQMLNLILIKALIKRANYQQRYQKLVHLFYPSSGRIVTNNIVMTRVSFPRGLTNDSYFNHSQLQRNIQLIMLLTVGV